MFSICQLILKESLGVTKKNSAVKTIRQLVSLQVYIKIYVILDLICFHVNASDVCKCWPCDCF